MDGERAEAPFSRDADDEDPVGLQSAAEGEGVPRGDAVSPDHAFRHEFFDDGSDPGGWEKCMARHVRKLPMKCPGKDFGALRPGDLHGQDTNGEAEGRRGMGEPGSDQQAAQYGSGE